MSLAGMGGDFTDDEVAALRDYLLGGVFAGTDRDPGQGNVTNWQAGILRRLTQAFPGDPVAPHQQLALGAAVTVLAPPAAASSALVQVEAQSVRVTLDGSAPTAAFGFLYPAGTTFALQGVAAVQGFQVIRVAAGAILNVAYFT